MSTTLKWLSVPLLAAATLAAPPAADAQSGRKSQVELGTFGVYTRYDGSNLALRNEFGAGGRLGYYFTNTLFLEAVGDYTETAAANNARVTAARLGGTLFANTPILGTSSFVIGAGYERAFYRSAAEFDENGIHLVMGPRLSLGGRAAIRLEGRATYVPNPGALGASGGSINIAASAGLSVYSFGGPPRDLDRDGVANRGDSCPDTPRGALVDGVGCPTDQDVDLVFDGLDACPDTPSGAEVDVQGCPSDDDSDSVLNGIDICPDTPAGAIADANGCPTDSDSDAVFDGIDQCADTPVGAIVDTTGCPSDEDVDGVFDGIDQCPGTAAGTPVDETGCELALDDDSDGVVNSADECPNTPPGSAVNERGCIPDTDSDGDGVVDRLDRCPATAPGTAVDQVGCPVLFTTDETTQRTMPLILQGVNFATGSSNLTPSSGASLDLVAQSLLGNPEIRIEIAGHTDATGSRATNNRLSLARARAVMQYLAGRGVALDRMMAQGYGPDQPIATNSTREGRAQNRRVELRRLN